MRRARPIAGLHPSVLSERGLGPALEALALRAPLSVELAAVPDRALPEQVEAAAYYVVAEALANIHMHAGAHGVAVRATSNGEQLTVEVFDDGVAGADEAGGGLRGSPTASKPSAGASRSRVPPASAHASSPKFPTTEPYEPRTA